MQSGDGSGDDSFVINLGHRSWTPPTLPTGDT